MKFIADHRDVSRHLKGSEWVGSSKLIVASYFFWNAAKDPSQKSQAGLLRSILYQILRQYPDLISAAFPTSRLSFEKGFPLPDTFREVPHLLDALKNVSEADPNHHIKFCFFIDGLDEYDGKPDIVIKFIDLIRKFGKIKICVSSRPWNEFQQRFGIGEWELSVHELTKNDIRTYVEETLGADPAFTSLRDSDQRYPDLVTTIIDSADGVFFWVVLVIRSLLEGLTNADRIVDLQKRLAEIPTDLEAFFEKILFTVDDRYRRATATAFIISLQAASNLPLLSHWFFDELDENPEYAFQLHTRALPESEIESRAQQSMKRLNARCKGLLESRVVSDRTPFRDNTWVKKAFTCQVDFFHRTVRDFLELDFMQKRLKTWSAGNTAVDSTVCCGIIAMIKSVPSLIASNYAPQFMETFFHHAQRLPKDDLDSHLSKRLPLELHRVLQTRGIFDYDLWTSNLADYRGSLRSADLKLNVSQMDPGFLCACVAAGLVAYSSQALQNHPNLVKSIGHKLLSQALASSPDGQHDFESKSEKVDLVILLLQKGVDPNRQDHFYDPLSRQILESLLVRVSAWELFLVVLRELRRESTLKDDIYSSNAFLCCEALLRHGVDPCAEVDDRPAYSFLKDVFTQDQYYTLQRVFHPLNNENAAAIKGFLSEADSDCEAESGPRPISGASNDERDSKPALSQQPERQSSHQSKPSPPVAYTKSTGSTSKKGFMAKMRQIREHLKT